MYILRETDLKLKDAVEMCLHNESTEMYIENMSYPVKEESTYKVKTNQLNKKHKCVILWKILKRGAINCSPRYKKQLLVKIQLAKVVKLQLDSGANCNVMSVSDFKRLLGSDSPILNKSAVTLTFYGGTWQKSLGSIVLKTGFKKSFYHLRFEIMESENNPLIGASDF